MPQTQYALLSINADTQRHTCMKTTLVCLSSDVGIRPSRQCIDLSAFDLILRLPLDYSVVTTGT